MSENDPQFAIPWETATAFQRASLAYDAAVEHTQAAMVQLTSNPSRSTYQEALDALEDVRSKARAAGDAEDLMVTFALPNLTEEEVRFLNMTPRAWSTRVDDTSQDIDRLRAIGRTAGWEE